MKHCASFFLALSFVLFSGAVVASAQETNEQIYWFTFEHLDKNEFKTGAYYKISGEYATVEACESGRADALDRHLKNPSGLSGQTLEKTKCQFGTPLVGDTPDGQCEIINGERVCNTPYTLLSKLPLIDAIDETTTFGQYLNVIFRLIIGLTTLSAVVMIIFGGMQYMTTDAFTGKAEGIEKVKTALWGLGLGLFSWIILNTINPDLLDLNFIKQDKIVRVSVEDEPEFGIPGILGTTEIGPLPNSIGTPVYIRSCDQSVMVSVTAFGGKTFRIYKGLAPSIARINAKWEAQPETTRYVVDSIGGYDCRTVAGTNTISAHAFGMAIDINPDQNPHTKDGSQVTNIPASFSSLFTQEEWGWGAEWETSSDPMHFSKYPTIEGGDGRVETVTSLSTD